MTRAKHGLKPHLKLNTGIPLCYLSGELAPPFPLENSGVVWWGPHFFSPATVSGCPFSCSLPGMTLLAIRPLGRPPGRGGEGRREASQSRKQVRYKLSVKGRCFMKNSDVQVTPPPQLANADGFTSNSGLRVPPNPGSRAVAF